MVRTRPSQDRLDAHTLFSASNDRRLEHWTWTPEGTGPFPLVLLLHGVYDGPSCWWVKGDAHETAARLVAEGQIPPVVLLMAGDTGAAQGSGYCDWADGTVRAETYVVDELLAWAETSLPVTGTRRWVSGLSMGGYGAFVLALRHPGLFEAAVATSGFFDPIRIFDFVPDAATRMWGEAGPVASGHDPRQLLTDAERRGGLRIAFDCGTDDALLDENRALHAQLDDLGVAHGYREHAGGHDWPYWREHLADHLRFLAAASGPLS